MWLEEFKGWLRWDAAREAMFCTVCERHEGRTAKGNNKVGWSLSGHAVDRPSVSTQQQQPAQPIPPPPR